MTACERLVETIIEQERMVIENQVEATGRRIDCVVHELYGLAE